MKVEASVLHSDAARNMSRQTVCVQANVAAGLSKLLQHRKWEVITPDTAVHLYVCLWTSKWSWMDNLSATFKTDPSDPFPASGAS